MDDDENKHFLQEINTRYNDKINQYFLGFTIHEAADVLRSNYIKFIDARSSYRIEERIEEILQKMGFSIENDSSLEKYLNLDDNEEVNEDETVNKKKDEINENIKNIKNKYKVLLNDLSKIYKDYLNIKKKAYDDRFYYIYSIGFLEVDFERCSSKKEANKMYINITTDMNKRLNNDYKNYEKKFINMIELLKNIKNKIN